MQFEPEMLLLWGTALAGFVILAATVWQMSRARSSLKSDMVHIPGPWRHSWPLLGNLVSVARLDFHRVFLHWANQYGGIYRMKMLWHDWLVVTDPAAVATICGRGEGAMDKASLLYNNINGMTSPHGHANLLTAPADKTWHVVRKAVAQSFSFNNIKRKFPLILERVDALIARLHQFGPHTAVDMDQMALRVTLDVIGLAGFGYSFNSVEQSIPSPPNHLLRILPRCFTEIMLRFGNPLRSLAPWLFCIPQPGLFGWGPRGAQSFKNFQQEMKKLLDAVRSQGPDPTLSSDMSMGMQLWRLLHGGSVNEGRVLSEIGILFVEGFETTGHTIGWTLLNIAMNPGVQQKVTAELDSLGLLVKPHQPGSCCSDCSDDKPSGVLHSSPTHVKTDSGSETCSSCCIDGASQGPRQLQLEDLKQLKYLTACVKEAMRMYPVVSVMSRVTPGPTRVGPYMVPGGVPVMVPLYAIQNSQHNWEAPEEFRPERWMKIPIEAYVTGPMAMAGLASGDRAPSGTLEEQTDSSTDRAAASRSTCYMPFSDGPRSCVGQSLAKLEVMAVMAKLLSCFHVELAAEMGGAEGVRKRESTLLTLQTSGSLGIPMHMWPRDMPRQHTTS